MGTRARSLPSLLAAVALLLPWPGLSRQSEFPKLTGPYLGQKPPGMQPKVIEELRPKEVQAPSGQTAAELPLHTERFGDRVLFAWAGDDMQLIRTVALSTAKGVVVIEANLLRSVDARIRQAVEKEFGRKDIKYLINTHFHHDHTAGNQVYGDATIVGHRTVPEGMKSELVGEGLVKQLDKFKAMLKDWGERLEKAPPDSKDARFFREGLIVLRSVIEELQTGFQPTFPTVLFEKSLILDMGDRTVELYSVGGNHTASDIMIFVPEEGLVAVGDMWPDQVLPNSEERGALGSGPHPRELGKDRRERPRDQARQLRPLRHEAQRRDVQAAIPLPQSDLGRPSRAEGRRCEPGGGQGQVHDRARLPLFQGQDTQDEGHRHPPEQRRGDLGKDRGEMT